MASPSAQLYEHLKRQDEIAPIPNFRSWETLDPTLEQFLLPPDLFAPEAEISGFTTFEWRPQPKEPSLGHLARIAICRAVSLPDAQAYCNSSLTYYVGPWSKTEDTPHGTVALARKTTVSYGRLEDLASPANAFLLKDRATDLELTWMLTPLDPQAESDAIKTALRPGAPLVSASGTGEMPVLQ